MNYLLKALPTAVEQRPAQPVRHRGPVADDYFDRPNNMSCIHEGFDFPFEQFLFTIAH